MISQISGIIINKVDNFRITSYYDVDYGGDITDRKNQTDIVVCVGGTLE